MRSKLLAADQLGEADARRRPAFGRTTPSATTRSSALTLRRLRGEIDQRLARGRRGLADLHAAALDAVRAGGAALIGRQRGVALDIFDLVDADAELLGGDLRDRDAQALAEIDLAAEDGDGAVAVDGEEGVDLLADRGRAPRRRRPCAKRALGQAGERKADGERAALEERAAGEASGVRWCVHVSLPVPMPPSRRARRAHGCRSGRDCRRVRRGSRPRSASAFRASSAAALMIMPLVQ